jgi:hypothetical protein
MVCSTRDPLNDGVFRKVNEVSRRFLWNGRKPLVDFEKLQQPRSKGGLGLLHAAKQAKALLGKWIVRVLNPDGPPWCRLARALLTRHLAAAGRVPSDLLAGSDWHRYRKEMAPLWRSLLSAWDGMKGGMINSGRLSSSVGLALSASLVFIRTEDGKPCKTTDAWRRAGINHAHDIIHRCAQRRHIHVKEVDSTIHRRLRKAWTEGRLELAPMFRAMEGNNNEVVEEHEAMWQLASLAGVPLKEYTPKVGRDYQLAQSASITSIFQHSSTACNTWKTIDRKEIMPKMRSLLWLANAGAYWTAQKLAAFTNMSPVCANYNEAPETVAHALVECRPANIFWNRVHGVMSTRTGRCLDTTSMLTLQMKQGPRWHRLSNEMALVTACGLWVVHRARIRCIYNNTAVTVESLWAEWRALLREILPTKCRTAIERGTLTKFCARWRHLLRFVEPVSMA